MAKKKFSGLWKSIAAPFDKLDDALQSLIDATFGWSNTKQKERLHKIKTKTKEDMLRTQAELDKEKALLDVEIEERKAKFESEMESIKDASERENKELEYKIWKDSVEFKSTMLEKITKIVSDLQNEHSRKVMTLLSDYKKEQTTALKEMENFHNENMEKISIESKQYKEDFPEIFKIKLEQLQSALSRHNELASNFAEEMSEDVNNIRKWLLDTSKFNAENFIHRISGDSNGGEFNNYLLQKGVDLKQIESEIE